VKENLMPSQSAMILQKRMQLRSHKITVICIVKEIAEQFKPREINHCSSLQDH
jgi:hypothetical protein